MLPPFHSESYSAANPNKWRQVIKTIGDDTVTGIFQESVAISATTRPDRMIFVAKGNREACRPGLTGVVPESAWRVIYNGTDLTHFKPDPEAGAAFRSLKSEITPASRTNTDSTPAKIGLSMKNLDMFIGSS